MGSKIKILVIVFLVLVLLSGVVAALMLTAPTVEIPEDESQSEEITSRLLYDLNTDNIVKIEIDNETSEYAIDRISTDDITIWLVAEYFNAPINFTQINRVMEQAATLTSQQVVTEKAEDLSLYGLDNPRVRYTITLDDGTVQEILLGNDVPNLQQVYMKFVGQDTIQTVNKLDVNALFDDKKRCVDKILFSTKSAKDETDTTNYNQVYELEISRKDLEYDIKIEQDTRQGGVDIISANASGYVMTSPVELNLDPDKSKSIMTAMFGFTAEDFALIEATEEDYEEYGISDPFATIYTNTASGELNIRVGNEYFDEDGVQTGYYGAVDGIDVIYIFKNSYLPWLEFSPLEVTTPLIVTSYVYDLENIEITGEEIDADFDFTGEDADTFGVTLNGNAMDNILFKDFYMYILRLPAEELYFDEIDQGEPRVTIKLKSSTDEDLIELYDLPNRRTAIKLNGVVSFSCKTAYVDRLLDNYGFVENGEAVIPNW